MISIKENSYNKINLSYDLKILTSEEMEERAAEVKM
jgi:hypothetical protein